ncbi:hypothetical protein GMORB2_0179 [Geosmithia morbida]|uniref:Zn(2)-C6 fungal-type domain-containing protein n=1 Tax=Geosmithia morbida TaxID=1094350 RepID=A0A9P4Z0H4_9HYPO|nr:uncharacterized protein GMORB2_0179 [Geosmithia morbida]KAF4126443.1 hypothetical protein GMORB2_0179 [Geosmithia morbida]
MSHVTLKGRRTAKKTFTGCWTCRTRKIKCDEGKPACYQCTSKKFSCEGYGVRLLWISENHDLGSNVSQKPLQHHEVDNIITSIDAFVPADQDQVSKPLFIHNFGVFEISSDSAVTSPTVAVGVVDNSQVHDTGENRWQSGQHFVDGTSYIFPEGMYGSPSTNESAGFPNDEDSRLRAPDHHQHGFAQDDPGNDDLASRSSQVADKAERRSPSLERYACSPYFFTVPPALKSSPLSDTERFLMHHYMHRVVNLFCVIDNQKSPWKLIHLPRALQSVGELNVNGSSTRIRDALRNALLSISAFCLSNDGTLRRCGRDAAAWAHRATQYRGKSIKLLKDSVEKDLHAPSRPGYKELLATMLSMVTINVISGDTSTCKVHLDGALRLMRYARSWKTRYSSKAQSLHRIYFYLRTIYESTAVDYALERPSDPSQSVEAGAAALSVLDPLSLGTHQNDSSMDTCSTPSAVPDPANMTTWECIYGVPLTMLVLLSRTTHLISKLDAFRQRFQTTAIPEELAAKCDELEITIMDLLAQSSETQRGTSEETPSSTIIRKTTSAFHNALIVYFAQHVRLLGYRYLQPYVQEVLNSIRDIETIKAEKQILAAPLFWPAFIASSEAFDNPIQAEFKDWYRNVEVYGIESVRTGIMVLEQVWADGPTAGRRYTSQWMGVVRKTGLRLMLS